MEEVFKYAQEGLKQDFGYTGEIDGEIGRGSEAALNRIRGMKETGWDRSRKAIAYAQARLNEAGAKLEVDGLWGKRSGEAWLKFGPDKGKRNAEAPRPFGPTSNGWMPGIDHDPRWNHDSCPNLNAVGVVLHRSAGHFATGDYKAGKWGNAGYPPKKGNTLGFHFLIGKNPGELIQFCSVRKRVSHVKRWAASYVGIEFSGDVGQWRDGLVHGQPLSDWQIEAGIRVIKWITDELAIPRKQIKHETAMFQLTTPFHGLLAHRDLSGNDHADSPNRADWKKIMAGL